MLGTPGAPSFAGRGSYASRKIYFDRQYFIMLDKAGEPDGPLSPHERPVSLPPRTPPPRPAAEGPDPSDSVDAEILRAVRGLRFGSVEIVVHEGNVVQIVRTERLRLGGAAQGGRKPSPP